MSEGESKLKAISMSEMLEKFDPEKATAIAKLFLPEANEKGHDDGTMTATLCIMLGHFVGQSASNLHELQLAVGSLGSIVAEAAMITIKRRFPDMSLQIKEFINEESDTQH